MLSRNPNIKAFYAANDTMAMGVAQAVINAGKQGKILVVGTDGVPEAKKMVSEGKLTATVAQDPASIGAKGLKLLVEAVSSGKQIAISQDSHIETVDSILVTQ